MPPQTQAFGRNHVRSRCKFLARPPPYFMPFQILSVQQHLPPHLKRGMENRRDRRYSGLRFPGLHRHVPLLPLMRSSLLRNSRPSRSRQPHSVLLRHPTHHGRNRGHLRLSTRKMATAEKRCAHAPHGIGFLQGSFSRQVLRDTGWTTPCPDINTLTHYIIVFEASSLNLTLLATS